MIYVEIIENKPTRSTSFKEIGKNYKNCITTDHEDYTPINSKYSYDAKTNSIVLNPHDNRLKNNRIAEIKLRLYEIDKKSYRAMRALICNMGTSDDIQYLQSLENEASVLREELRKLI